METDIFNILNTAIMETQINGKNILYFSGKYAGYEYMKDFKENIKKLEDIEKLLQHILKKLSIGSIKNVIIRKNKILIDIESASKAKGYFLVGFITGIISRVLNYNFYRFRGSKIRYKNKEKHSTFEIISI